jgi:nucleoside-diphosphate-sugar epimerase
MSGLHVVLGSNGGTGSAVLEELTRRKLPARGVTRRGTGFQPEGAELVAADITDPEALAAALAGAAVVYQCAQPAYTRWPQEFPQMNRSVIQAAAAVGAKLVFADNLYLYAPGTDPMREDSPATAPGKKGRTRVEMAAELLRAHADGKLRVAIGRSSDYYGPRGLDSGIGERVFAGILRGKKLSWLGSLDQPHTVSYLPDMARGLVTLGTEDGADGQAWHLPAGPAVIGREFLTAVCDAAGKPQRFSAVAPAMLRIAGIFSPMVREIKETTYQWTGPWIVDTAKFRTAFGPFIETPMADAVAATIEWFRRREASSA